MTTQKTLISIAINLLFPVNIARRPDVDTVGVLAFLLGLHPRKPRRQQHARDRPHAGRPVRQPDRRQGKTRESVLKQRF